MSKLKLPIQPPTEPMLALLSRDFPESGKWIYEFKYDGFRAIVFWDGDQLMLQSRDLKPLNRYFPEVESFLRKLLPDKCVLDGEIVIETPKGLDFEALLLRIHPAASRVQKLAAETPASFVAFDLLATGTQNLMDKPFRERQKELVKLLKKAKPPLRITPATEDLKTAKKWFTQYEGAGIDGIICKDPQSPYTPGERTMIKVKHKRTADCVVAGFRWNKNQEGVALGSLLLGLYQGKTLHYVGHASNFKAPQRKELVKFLKPYRENAENAGFGKGRTPGGPSRWSQLSDKSWEPLRPELVCEVAYDHMQGDRFRHGSSFLRWRFDKPPRECTYQQLQEASPVNPAKIFQL
jgi:ATP-dependent DNA ligase